MKADTRERGEAPEIEATQENGGTLVIAMVHGKAQGIVKIQETVKIQEIVKDRENVEEHRIRAIQLVISVRKRDIGFVNVEN